MNTIVFILQILALLGLLLLLALCFLWLWTILRAKVPFIPIRNNALPDIAALLRAGQGSVVYDLGCGDARVLLYLASRIEGATFIGIENGIFPRLIARTKLLFLRPRLKSKVLIVSRDFFSCDLSNATHVFVYLYGRVLDALLPKLTRELGPGARLVSAAFRFSEKEPIKQQTVTAGTYDIAKELYVYEF